MALSRLRAITFIYSFIHCLSRTGLFLSLCSFFCAELYKRQLSTITSATTQEGICEAGSNIDPFNKVSQVYALEMQLSHPQREILSTLITPALFFPVPLYGVPGVMNPAETQHYSLF